MSFLEAGFNVLAGYGLALGTQIIAFPWFGLHPSLRENLAISTIFVSVSLLRSYSLRRLFEWIRLRTE